MEKQDITTGFQHVDLSQHQFLIKFLEDVSAHPQVIEGFETQVRLLDIKEGDHVLDIGCGIGLQAQEMAKRVGPNGRVVGTDLSSAMIDISKSRTAGSNLPLEFCAADAHAQPFPDQSFDCIRTERVLMYIRDIDAVLGEYKRLLKPGGRVVVFDMDWDGIIIAHRDKALTRRIIRYAADSFPSGRIGAELFFRFRKLGFKNVQAQPSSYSGSSPVVLSFVKRVYEGILQTGVANNVFTQEEITNWWETFDKDASEGNLFASFQGFITSGRKE